MRLTRYACATCTLALLVGGSAVADDFTEFRIPPNRALLWTAGFGTDAFTRDSGYPSSESSFGRLGGNLSTRISWFSDSDPALTLLGVGLAAMGDRIHSTAESETFTPLASSTDALEQSGRAMAERWTLDATQRRYPWTPPIGFEAAGSLSGNYFQLWESSRSEALDIAPGSSVRITQAIHSQSWLYVHGVVATASVGWGRVRNATGIYDAQVLERRLLEAGALTRPLSSAARRRLAELMYLRGAHATVRERPGRSLWREIERVLSEDGALAEGGLDPFSVLRGSEPHLGVAKPTADGVPFSPIARLAGSFVGVRLADSHLNLLERRDEGSFLEVVSNGTVTTSTGAFAARSTLISDRVEGGAVGEIHRPIGGAWQLDATGAVLLGLRRQQNHLNLDSGLSLAWLAPDRWMARATGSYLWIDDDRTRGGRGGDQWASTLNLGVTCYLEDRTAVEFRASQDQRWTRGDADATLPGRRHVFIRDNAASLAVTYRFAGWFEAPGFFSAAGVGTATPPDWSRPSP